MDTQEKRKKENGKIAGAIIGGNFLWRLKLYSIIISAGLLGVFSLSGCGSGSQGLQYRLNQFYSPEVQRNLKEVVPSIVGIGTSFRFRVEFYRYELRDGFPIRDTASPTGYRLLQGEAGSAVVSRVVDARGCGVLLQRNDRKCLVMTGYHILTMPDTMFEYYRDISGRPTDRIASRAVKVNAVCFVLDQTNTQHAARILVEDPKSDLALVEADASLALISEFPCDLTFEKDLTWGDPVYVFGFPQALRQIMTAVVSPAPYPGFFTIDASVRHGFSGGPVLLVRGDGSLALAGIVRSVPGSKLRYLLPPTDLPMGASLTAEDLANTIVAEDDLPEAGMTYVVGISKIKKFLQDNANNIRREGFFPPLRSAQTEE
jgi:S1-C subfamily serine protease